MYAMLASIGIERGRAFQPTGEQTELFDAAVAEAAALMNDYFLDEAFEPQWTDRQWLRTSGTTTSASRSTGTGNSTTTGGPGRSPTGRPGRQNGWGPSKLPASYYVNGFRASRGTCSTAIICTGRDSRRHPGRNFWSIVVYEIGTNAFIHNDQNTVGLSSDDIDRLIVGDDGSIDLHIGPNRPMVCSPTGSRPPGETSG